MMENTPTAQPLFPHLPERLAGRCSGSCPASFWKRPAPMPTTIRRYDDVLDVFNRQYMRKKACHLLAPFAPDHKYAVAYFSAEYGLHRSLPFYAGGLGFLAGDYIKECSDLCVPLVAVGFMYPEGYFRQQIRDDGWQENIVESINREAAPISRVLDKDGRQRIVKVPLTDPPIHVAVWKVAVGRVLPLFDGHGCRNQRSLEQRHHRPALHRRS
jgi:starch phosphorylase